MLFRALVLLAARPTLLMKGVAPAVWPVILTEVSSAWLASARWEKTMTTAQTVINEHTFISVYDLGAFFVKSARAWQRTPARVQQNVQRDTISVHESLR